MSRLDIRPAPHEPSHLLWYAARLSAMSPRELVWRLNTGVGSPVRERRAARTPARLTWGGSEWVTALVELAAHSVAAVERDAERIASGWLDLWGTPVLTHPTQPRWRTHPFAERPWPRGSWRGWPHDPKPVWELHRHQHLVPLAAGSVLAERPDWARTAIAHVLDWIERNEPGSGPGWTSSYEIAHRLVSWTFAVPLLASCLSRADRARIDASFTAQARFLAMHPSRYSSANNHRVAELVGLLAVALVESDGTGWRRTWAELEAEAARQTFADGGSREQAAGYFLYVLELLTVAALLAAGRNEPLGGIEERIRAMLGWLARVADDEGEPPALGDDAEDRMLRLDYFEPRSAATVARRAREGVDWGASRLRDGAREGVATAVAGSCLLPESGLAVFRDRCGDEGIRLVVDVGELGFGRLAAHGHADALSVLLSCGGVDLLRDSGTGSYVRSEGRDAFRCTAAHNTVVVDGQSQARALGPHLWGHRYRVTIESAELAATVDQVRASHDGYRSQPARAVHTRSVMLLRPGLVVVLDRIRSRRDCECRLVWNLMPGDVPSSLGGGRAALTVASPPGTQVADGRRRLSLRYASQQEAPSWTWTVRGRDVVFATAVALRPDTTATAPLPHVEIDHDGDATVVRILAPRPVTIVERWRGGAAEIAVAAAVA